MDKRALSERDICTKLITPALRRAGWDEISQIREEVGFTKGRIIVRGKLVSRGRAKRADYILYYKPNIPLALFDAKDNSHSTARVCSKRWNTPRHSTFPLCFRRTETASRSTIAPEAAPRKKRIWGSAVMLL